MFPGLPLPLGGGAHRRHFSTSIAQWQTYNRKLAVPSWAAACQDASIESASSNDSSNPLTDWVAGNNLYNNIGISSGALELQYGTIGRAIADDGYGRYAAKWEGTASRMRCLSVNTLDAGTGPITGFCRYYAIDTVGDPQGGTEFGPRKKSVSAGTNGYKSALASSGNIVLTTDTPAGAADTTTLALGASNAYNVWVDYLFSIGATIRMFARVGRDANNAGVGFASEEANQNWGGSYSNAASSYYFGMGDTQGNLNIALECYYSYAAVWLTGSLWTQDMFDYLIGLSDRI